VRVQREKYRNRIGRSSDMLDFVFGDLLNFNYFAPFEIRLLILRISLALHVSCLLLLALCFFDGNKKFFNFLKRGYNFFISKTFIASIVGINMLLILVATKREIIASLVMSSSVLVVYAVLVLFLLSGLREDDEQHEF